MGVSGDASVTDAWDEAAEATKTKTLPLNKFAAEALMRHVTKHDHLYDGGRLRVGADLKPDGEGCDRATWYRVHGAKADPPQIARRLRYERGRAAQRIFVEALAESGRAVVEEVSARALRPSAWAWDSGHGDILDVKARHLYEVKCPGVDAWRRARGMPQKLVRETYRYQLSWYFHELARVNKVESASWIFFDLEGEFDPVEVPLDEFMLVPMSEIVRLEESKNHLVTDTEAPPRPANTFEVVKVLKGGRKTKKNPNPQREVTAVERRYWGCRFCDFLGACQPGPEEMPVELAADDPRRIKAVADAEVEWAREAVAKKTDMVVISETIGETVTDSFLRREAEASVRLDGETIVSTETSSQDTSTPPEAPPIPRPDQTRAGPPAPHPVAVEAQAVLEEAKRVSAEIAARDAERVERAPILETKVSLQDAGEGGDRVDW